MRVVGTRIGASCVWTDMGWSGASVSSALPSFPTGDFLSGTTIASVREAGPLLIGHLCAEAQRSAVPYGRRGGLRTALGEPPEASYVCR